MFRALVDADVFYAIQVKLLNQAVGLAYHYQNLCFIKLLNSINFCINWEFHFLRR